MGKRTRFVIEAIIFAAVVLVVVTLVQVARGYYMTQNYVPDIIETYSSVDILQQKVSIGSTSATKSNWFIPAGWFVVLAVIYFTFRNWFSGKRMKRSAGQ